MEAMNGTRVLLHRSAWTAPEQASGKAWVFTLDAKDNAEINAAIAHAKQCNARIPRLSRESFPLPTLAVRIGQMQEELVNGLGFAVVEGLDIANMPVEDVATAFWGIGTYLGVGRAQNAQGDLLGHVTDLGLDYRSNTSVRGYQTRLVLPFHNDALDVVGLCCIRQAKSGGASRVVSSTAIHDAIAKLRPDLLEVAYQDFYQDKRGEQIAGELPYSNGPIFSIVNGRLFCRYNRLYCESAQRYPDVPRLSKAQIALMDMIDALCADPKFCLDMHLRPGDMQFLCNYTTLHSRTEYEDWPEFDRRRYLLRLWLDTGRFSQIPQSFADRYQDMRCWQENPKPPVFDLSMIRSELAH